MASLSSISTDAEVKAAYDDNAGYAEDDSVAMARTFVTACRILLRRLPKMAKLGGRHEVQIDPRVLQQELADARQFVSENATDGSVRAFSVENYRD
jgi:hypothetical protein